MCASTPETAAHMRSERNKVEHEARQACQTANATLSTDPSVTVALGETVNTISLGHQSVEEIVRFGVRSACTMLGVIGTVDGRGSLCLSEKLRASHWRHLYDFRPAASF